MASDIDPAKAARNRTKGGARRAAAKAGKSIKDLTLEGPKGGNRPSSVTRTPQTATGGSGNGGGGSITRSPASSLSPSPKPSGPGTTMTRTGIPLNLKPIPSVPTSSMPKAGIGGPLAFGAGLALAPTSLKTREDSDLEAFLPNRNPPGGRFLDTPTATLPPTTVTARRPTPKPTPKPTARPSNGMRPSRKGESEADILNAMELDRIQREKGSEASRLAFAKGGMPFKPKGTSAAPKGPPKSLPKGGNPGPSTTKPPKPVSMPKGMLPKEMKPMFSKGGMTTKKGKC
jgi:hypothetical protein